MHQRSTTQAPGNAADMADMAVEADNAGPGNAADRPAMPAAEVDDSGPGNDDDK